MPSPAGPTDRQTRPYQTRNVDLATVWNYCGNCGGLGQVVDKCKVNNPITGLDRPWRFQEVEAPRFQDSRHMKAVRLSALRTGCFYTPGNIPGIHFCQRLSRPQGHSAAGRIMSMKNSDGNRTRELPACSAVPLLINVNGCYWQRQNFTQSFWHQTPMAQNTIPVHAILYNSERLSSASLSSNVT